MACFRYFGSVADLRALDPRPEIIVSMPTVEGRSSADGMTHYCYDSDPHKVNCRSPACRLVLEPMLELPPELLDLFDGPKP